MTIVRQEVFKYMFRLYDEIKCITLHKYSSVYHYY